MYTPHLFNFGGAAVGATMGFGGLDVGNEIVREPTPAQIDLVTRNQQGVFSAQGETAQNLLGMDTSEGSPALQLLRHNMDWRCLRPYIDRQGRAVMALHSGRFDQDPKSESYGEPILRKVLARNAPALLTKEAWMRIDDTILEVSRPELQIVGDLRAAGLVYNLPNAMGTITIMHQTMTDVGTAIISMDPVRESQRDRPAFDQVLIPVPVISSDFFFTVRDIAVSQQSGAPLDTAMPEMSARRVAEQIDALTIGTAGSFSYGGGTIYGITNHPNRITFTPTLPTAAGWSPATTYQEINSVLQTARDNRMRGPWGIYFSYPWQQYLNLDYSAANPTGPRLIQRLREFDGVRFVRTLDTLTGYQIVLVQLQRNTIEIVNGIDITTLQWRIGMELRWKIYAIVFPRVRADASGKTGILHGVAA